MHITNHKLPGRHFTLAIVFLFSITFVNAQSTLKGTVFDHLNGQALEQVLITVSNASEKGEVNSTLTDAEGNFEVNIADGNILLVAQLPGYHTRNIYVYGKTTVRIALVNNKFNSMDEAMMTPLGEIRATNSLSSLSHITSKDINKSTVTSVDSELYAKISGVNMIGHSGMPGHRNFISIRGFSSMIGRNEPLFIIDGMIHESNYGNYSAIDGFNLNPMDVLDVDDLTSVSVLKNAQSYLGGKGSNGVIYMSTEQKAESSTSIKFHFQGGIATMPSMLETEDADEFRTYMNDQLIMQNLNQTEIDSRYLWLNEIDTIEQNRYKNNTNWQNEIFRTGKLQKYHFFLKGGDDIATYNISTGYVNHEGILNNSKYTRYNLKINGLINLSQKLSITPHAKLGLATSQLQEQGYNQVSNPILAAQLKPAVMAPYTENQSEEGESFLDDVGVFGLSNPAAIVSTLAAENMNFHFLTSAKVNYNFSDRLSLASTIGMDYNNSRDNIFIPDHGLAEIDSARNTTRSRVTFFQSLQNHTTLSYQNMLNGAHNLSANVGMWYMENTYEFDQGTDLNSPTDDFTSLGQGAEDQFLRTSTGSRRALNWISYYTNIDYNFLGKYYINAALALDGSSAINELNRYNLYPSISGAWKISSEDFLYTINWIDELKLRSSFGITGNTYNTAYDFSRLFYTSRRLNEIGVLTREAIPNENMQLEKKSMVEAGLDLIAFNQKLSVQVNYFNNMVNNMIVPQQLPSAYGYTLYFSNGGAYNSSGFEMNIDYRTSLGDFVWVTGINLATQSNKITSLDLGDAAENDYLITIVEGAELVTKIDHPLFSFYGYETNGTYSEGEAGTVIGPNGGLNKAGDIRYAGDDDGIIDENDKVIIGNPNPNMFGGLFNSIQYKNLSLNIHLSFNSGIDLYNYVNMKSKSIDRLSGLNDGTDININDSYGNYVFSNQWIESGSFIKLNNISLAYTFKKGTRVYKNLMIYAKGSNLLTFTPYSGYNPEFMFSTNPEYMGIDYGKMPLTKSFVIGIKVGL